MYLRTEESISQRSDPSAAPRVEGNTKDDVILSSLVIPTPLLHVSWLSTYLLG